MATQEVPEDWKEADGTSIIKKGKSVKKEDPGNCRTINFTSASGKAVAQILLTLIFKPMKDKTMEIRVYQGQNMLSLLLSFLGLALQTRRVQ